MKALADGRGDAIVGDVMFRDCRPVDEADILTPTLEVMGAKEFAAVPVVSGGQVVGLLTLENIGELIMVHAALAGSTSKPGTHA